MLDLRAIRTMPEEINVAIQRRDPTLSINAILALDEKRLVLLKEEETLRNERNILSKEIGQMKQAGQNTDVVQEKTRAMGDRIKEIEHDKNTLELEQNTLLYVLPNIPQATVPMGSTEDDNVFLKSWGDSFKARPQATVRDHWDIGVDLGLLDFERGVKVAQSRFSVLSGMGAKLERALINYMLDLHGEKGYSETLPPFLINPKSMFGTGQLPKFENDMFRCQDDALFLTPTAEVPLTNLYADEILDANFLPHKLVAYTPCFRREAGSAGKDTRGLIRQHQFNKVELVQFTKPEDSERHHLQLLADAEAVLQGLELPYRVIELCTADLGFSASRCFDIEVWMPAQGVYREISSCSNFQDFQARRANIKYRDPVTGKPAFVHTLNGSGLAVGRTLAAILENYQLDDNTIAIPNVLRPYLHDRREIKRNA
jgi:seryl-tRNA synthetase